MTVLGGDSFDGVAGTLITARTPTGPNALGTPSWVNGGVSGGTPPVPTLTGAGAMHPQVGPGTGQSHFFPYSGASAPADQYAEATFDYSAAGSTDGVFALCLRFDAASQMACYMAWFYNSGSQPIVYVYRVSATGGRTFLGSSNYTPLTTGNLGRWEISGTALTLTVNGTQLFTVTDTTLASGQPGIMVPDMTFTYTAGYTVTDVTFGSLTAAPANVNAVGSASLPHLTASGTGAATDRASGIATLPALTASGTGVKGQIGGASASGTATLPKLTATGTGAASQIGGAAASGNATLPHLTAVGSGSSGSLNPVSASGSVTLPALTGAATGDAGVAPPPPTPPDQGPGTPFPAPVLFPYEPNGSDSVTETLLYVTNIITSRNDSEQRIALRRRPVLTLKWKITAMEAQDAGKVAGLLYKQVNNRWYVPVWPDSRRIQGVNAGAYFVDTTAARFASFGKALVWRNPDTCDIMDVTAVNFGVVTLSGTTTFDHTLSETYLIPLGIGSLPASFSLDRIDFITGGSLEFTLDTTGTTEPAALPAAQLFRGVEVLRIHPDGEQDSTREEQWTISSEQVGTNLGPFLIRPFATTPVIGRPCSWVLTSWQEIEDFRGWLAARRGRKVPLWVPTYQDDFTLLTAAPVNSGWIDIAAVDFASNYFGSASRVHIAALFPDGTVDPLTVITVETPVTGVERLFLEAPLPHALPLETRLCLLVFARMTEDSTTFEHLGPALATVTGGFTELPRESPA